MAVQACNVSQAWFDSVCIAAAEAVIASTMTWWHQDEYYMAMNALVQWCPRGIASGMNSIYNIRWHETLCCRKIHWFCGKLQCCSIQWIYFDHLNRSFSNSIRCTVCGMDLILHRVSEKKTSTHIIGYKLRNSCLILIILTSKFLT